VEVGAAAPRDSVRIVLAWTLVVLLLLFAVLLGTGLWLTFDYRPTGPDLLFKGAPQPPGQVLHRIAALALMGVALLLIVETCWLAARRRFAPLPFAIGMFVLVLGAIISGLLLPWDQLALRVITAHRDFEGFTWIHDGTVRYVLVGHSEISPGAFQVAFWVHVAVTAPLAAACGTVVWRSRRER
jgi:hypothetical protein